MWPFSSGIKHLPPEQLERLRKKLRSERKAYQSCVKANGGDATNCQQLEVRLLERYSELACPEAAAAYQDCYSKSLARGDIVLDSCIQQVKQMRDCLDRLGINLQK